MTNIPSDLKPAVKALRSQGINVISVSTVEDFSQKKNDECTKQFFPFQEFCGPMD